MTHMTSYDIPLPPKVVSGQHLPKPEGGSKTGEIIDPYVVIEIVGIPEDKQEAKTKAVDDNGREIPYLSLSYWEPVSSTHF